MSVQQFEQCAVKSCTSVKGPDSKYSFHYMRFEWMLDLQTKGLLKEVTKKRLICSRHFKPEQVIERDGREFLVPNVTPTVNLEVDELLTSKKNDKNNFKEKPRPLSKHKPQEVASHEISKLQSKVDTKYKDLFKKHKIKECKIRWKPLTMKCALPSCKNISEVTMYAARLGGEKPRFILLCETHRDITEPNLFAFLTQRLGEVVSLRKKAIEIVDSDSEIEEAVTTENIKTNKRDNHKRKIEQSDAAENKHNAKKQKIEETSGKAETSSIKEGHTDKNRNEQSKSKEISVVPLKTKKRDESDSKNKEDSSSESKIGKQTVEKISQKMAEESLNQKNTEGLNVLSSKIEDSRELDTEPHKKRRGRPRSRAGNPQLLLPDTKDVSSKQFENRHSLRSSTNSPKMSFVEKKDAENHNNESSKPDIQNAPVRKSKHKTELIKLHEKSDNLEVKPQRTTRGSGIKPIDVDIQTITAIERSRRSESKQQTNGGKKRNENTESAHKSEVKAPVKDPIEKTSNLQNTITEVSDETKSVQEHKNDKVKKATEQEEKSDWRKVFIPKTKKYKPKKRRWRRSHTSTPDSTSSNSREKFLRSETGTPDSAASKTEELVNDSVKQPDKQVETVQSTEKNSEQCEPVSEKKSAEQEVIEIKKEKEDVICLDSDEEPSPPKISNPIIGNCCIPGCTTGEIVRGKTCFVAKIGEEPNIEFVLLCNQHRDYIDNVQNLEQVNTDLLPSTSVQSVRSLEEGEIIETDDLEAALPIAMVSNVNKLLPATSSYLNLDPIVETPILESPNRERIPIQAVRPTVQYETNTSTTVRSCVTAPVIQQLSEETNTAGHRLVSRQCLKMTSPKGVPCKYIVETWADGSIVHTPAPSMMPLGECTKMKYEYFKHKQKALDEVKERELQNQRNARFNIASTSQQTSHFDPSQILSSSHIKPFAPKTGLAKSGSQLVYIDGQPFVLTSVTDLVPISTNKPPNIQSLKSVQQTAPFKSAQARTVLNKVVSNVPKISSVMSLQGTTSSGSRSQQSTNFTSKLSSPMYNVHQSTLNEPSYTHVQNISNIDRSEIPQIVAVQSNVRNFTPEPEQLDDEDGLLEESSSNFVKNMTKHGSNATHGEEENEGEMILSDPIPVALTKAVNQMTQPQSTVEPRGSLATIRTPAVSTPGGVHILRKVQVKRKLIPPGKCTIVRKNANTSLPLSFSGAQKTKLVSTKSVTQRIIQTNKISPTREPSHIQTQLNNASMAYDKLKNALGRAKYGDTSITIIPKSNIKSPNRITRQSQNLTSTKLLALESPGRTTRQSAAKNVSAETLQITVATVPKAEPVYRPGPKSRKMVQMVDQSPKVLAQDDKSIGNQSKIDQVSVGFMPPVTTIPAIDSDEEVEDNGKDQVILTDFQDPLDPLAVNVDGKANNGKDIFGNSSHQNVPTTIIHLNKSQSNPTTIRERAVYRRLNKPTKTQKTHFNTNANQSRFFEVSVLISSNNKKCDKNQEDELNSTVVVATPIQYCEKCDLRFATAMRLHGHEQLCGVTKDPLLIHKTKEKSNLKIYVCRKCQRTSASLSILTTHVRRCKISLEEIDNYRSFFSCAHCRHNCVSLGEIEAHLDIACPILHADKVKNEQK